MLGAQLEYSRQYNGTWAERNRRQKPYTKITIDTCKGNHKGLKLVFQARDSQGRV